jgi:hypothetical protein
MKEERPGYTWVQAGSGGFWKKNDKLGRHNHKLNFFCPNKECNRITGTIDDKYLLEYGVCSKCYVMFIEGRKVPLIDIEYYKNLRSQ